MVPLSSEETRQLLDAQRQQDIVADKHDPPAAAVPTGFVDRQLKRALDYLSEQLAQR